MLSLTKNEELLLEILNDIVDKMNSDSQDKDEIRTKIEKLKDRYWYLNTGWGKPE